MEYEISDWPDEEAEIGAPPYRDLAMDIPEEEISQSSV